MSQKVSLFSSLFFFSSVYPAYCWYFENTCSITPLFKILWQLPFTSTIKVEAFQLRLLFLFLLHKPSKFYLPGITFSNHQSLSLLLHSYYCFILRCISCLLWLIKYYSFLHPLCHLPSGKDENSLSVVACWVYQEADAEMGLAACGEREGSRVEQWEKQAEIQSQWSPRPTPREPKGCGGSSTTPVYYFTLWLILL